VNQYDRGAEGGTCHCDVGWQGEDCSRKLCPDVNGTVCNGQGACDEVTGRCHCEPNFFGDVCELKHCPGFQPRFHPKHPLQRTLWSTDFYECHAGTKLSRGVCNLDVGECYCDAQFYGERCEFVRCPQHLGKDCNAQGKCIASTVVGGELPGDHQAPTQWKTLTEGSLNGGNGEHISGEDLSRQGPMGYPHRDRAVWEKSNAAASMSTPATNRYVVAMTSAGAGATDGLGRNTGSSPTSPEFGQRALSGIPSEPMTLTVKVDSGGAALIYLSEGGVPSASNGYEIVLGGWSNSKSGIRVGTHSCAGCSATEVTSTHNTGVTLTDGTPSTFTITKTAGSLTVRDPADDSVLLEYTSASKVITEVYLASDGNTAHWEWSGWYDGDPSYGYMKTYKGYGRCDCNQGYEGTACEHKKCPVWETMVCGGQSRGNCDQSSGMCYCEPGYWGADCSHGNGAVFDMGADEQ